MSITTIAIMGAWHTGIHAAVLLLEQTMSTILMYDADIDYVQGMALDCMQAASVKGCRGIFKGMSSLQDLQGADMLIISEQRDGKILSSTEMDNLIQEYEHKRKLCIFANQDYMFIPENTTSVGVHGLIDSKQLSTAASKVLDVSIKDIDSMVYGGVKENMQSREEWVRVCGIPIEHVQKGSYNESLSKARSSYAVFNEEHPWAQYYAHAAAASEIVLLTLGENRILIPVSTAKGTVPAFVNSSGYEEVHNV